jgi:hypothetical protein
MYSEEEILLVSSEDREEQKEENSQSLQDKFSFFHHVLHMLPEIHVGFKDQ